MKALLHIRAPCRGGRTAGVLVLSRWASQFESCLESFLDKWSKEQVVVSKRFKLRMCFTPEAGLNLFFWYFTDFLAEQLGLMGSSVFGPIASSYQKVWFTLMLGSVERSAGPSLLARNIYHIGGIVAVPQKCRFTLSGKEILKCLCVFVFCVQVHTINPSFLL